MLATVPWLKSQSDQACKLVQYWLYGLEASIFALEMLVRFGGSWSDQLNVHVKSVPLCVCQCCDEYWRPGWRNPGGLYSASPWDPTLSGLSLDGLTSNLADHCPTAENVLNSIAPSQLSSG